MYKALGVVFSRLEKVQLSECVTLRPSPETHRSTIVVRGGRGSIRLHYLPRGSRGVFPVFVLGKLGKDFFQIEKN